MKVNMNTYFLDVFPKIVPADATSTITIKSRYGQYFNKENAAYSYTVTAVENGIDDNYDRKFTYYPINLLDKGFKVDINFVGEQEHYIRIFEEMDGEKRNISTVSIYSLKPDLFELTPYKGDFHCHSYYSDGINSPEFFACAARRGGLDYAALTDHRRFFPSIKMKDHFKDAPIDITLFSGEEVHAPRNHVHIIHFGGEYSVNEIFQKNEEKYLEEVGDIQKNLPILPAGVNSYVYASSMWVFEKIKEAGGVSMFCHPFWKVDEQYNHSQELTDALFENIKWDLYEIIGGYYKWQIDSNILQVAYYNEQRSKGKKIPIAGVSDAHSMSTGELFDWYYTISFAKSTDLEDLKICFKNLMSLAVEKPDGETARVYGPYRLVKYAQFLIANVFDEHDRICEVEGEFMLRYLEDPQGNESVLEYLKGGVKSYYDKTFGR